MAKAIPDGYTAVTPYLIVKDVAAQLDFCTRAFGAVTHSKMQRPDGSIGHCDVSVNGAHVMMGQAMQKMSPMPTMLYLYVPDVDVVHAKALAAGAALDMPVTDQFYGDRAGSVRDANDNIWWIATHKEDLSDAQIAERMQAQFSNAAPAEQQ